MMHGFRRLTASLNVRPLLEELDAQPELWDQIKFRKIAPGSPHSRMSDIWVRYNDYRPFLARGDFSGLNDPHIPIWYPAWQKLPALRPLIFGTMERVQGEMLGGVLITRIPPGEGIEPHVDVGWHVNYYPKFYLSLRSAPGAEFFCEYGDTIASINPRPGDLYLFDNRQRHWVKNESDQDRITLIMCIRTELFPEVIQ
jgi:hypothetical protein